MTAPILDIKDLSVSYGPLQAVSAVDLSVGPGEIFGIIGESGCGKSTLVAAIMGMLPGSARIGGGAIRFGGRDLVGLPRDEMRRLRGGGPTSSPGQARGRRSIFSKWVYYREKK
jgi:ABC-type glutathione transport system ATPase component